MDNVKETITQYVSGMADEGSLRISLDYRGEERQIRFIFADILRRYHIIVQEYLRDVRICQRGHQLTDQIYTRGVVPLIPEGMYMGYEGCKKSVRESKIERESSGLFKRI